MRSLAFLMALALIVAACGSAGSTPGRSTAGPTEPGSGTAAASGPALLTIPLTDVRTGERFTLGDFPGKVTFFIAMAVW